MKPLRILVTMLLTSWVSGSSAGNLIVVEDRGGTTALPYYQDLEPELPAGNPSPVVGVHRVDAFPVRSAQLSPGTVQGRVINAPGLQPLFLVGDDPLSRSWLLQRRDQLQQLQAVGLAINVASEDRLAEIRRWAGDLQVLPAPTDDLAARLGLRHYPVLLTPTAIQQ